ncbi:MAG: hypothetical protein EXX96DRAFT_609924 [Benjaminiella poitrasii]|nr:MAG: hypothetical protein EXX96DRAFT_609924 [Benjaminiella poitrasii]
MVVDKMKWILESRNVAVNDSSESISTTKTSLSSTVLSLLLYDNIRDKGYTRLVEEEGEYMSARHRRSCRTKNERIDLELLHEELFNTYLSPTKEDIIYWAKMSLIYGLDLFLSKNYFPLNDQSESKIISRGWNMIAKAFGQRDIVARKYVAEVIWHFHKVFRQLLKRV